MPDREKVIKAIECCVRNSPRCFDDNDKLCPHFGTKDLMCEVELLKEAYSLLKEQDPVLCKNCAYAFFKEGVVQQGHIVCTKPYTERWQVTKPDDWYCADGKHKEEPWR